MNRFSSIIDSLRLQRLEIIKKKPRKAGVRKKKDPPKMTFESPELERIFNAMPEDCKELIRRGK